jgi:hypothetical protein
MLTPKTPRSAAYLFRCGDLDAEVGPCQRGLRWRRRRGHHFDPPEGGTTDIQRDDLVDWSADGQASSGTDQASCTLDRGAILASEKITRTHDPRHRELTRKIAGADFITTTYFADGQVNALTAANPGNAPVTTTYSYNNRRLLTQEVLSINAGAAVWTFAYAYNANGPLSSQTYPGNLLVGYSPDGLGRPTQVGTFATGVTYHPNGAIAGFNYGNGIVHSMTQNARQLPAQSLDSYGSGGNATKVLDDTLNRPGFSRRSRPPNRLTAVRPAALLPQSRRLELSVGPAGRQRVAVAATST